MLWRQVDESSEPDAAETDALSPEEWTRAERFLRRADRNRFILARASLRCALAVALNTSADAIRLQASAHGKPVLDPAHGRRLAFNVSRTHGMILLALTRAMVEFGG